MSKMMMDAAAEVRDYLNDLTKEEKQMDKETLYDKVYEDLRTGTDWEWDWGVNIALIEILGID